MSLLACRATPEATEVLKKVKTCSRWFHSQIIAVPEMTHNISLTSVLRYTKIIVITREDLISDT